MERTSFFTMNRKLVANMSLLILLQGVATYMAWRGAASVGDSAWLLGMQASALVATIAVTVFMHCLFVRPIRHINRTLADISSGDGDLTQDLQATTKDELAELAGHFNGFLAKLRDVMQDFRRMSVNAASESAKMTSLMKDSSAIAGQQGQLTQTIFAASAKATQAIDAVAENAQRMSSETGERLKTAEGSYRELLAVSDKISAMGKSLADFNVTVSELDKNSKNIAQLVKLINDISDQTNLLALNAAIEAARAGEVGRGFAVVADEVRKLAEKVKSATDIITNSIQNMTQLVDNTQHETQQINVHVEHTREVVQRSSRQFEDMMHGFNAMNSKIVAISGAIDGLHRVNGEIHEKVSGIHSLSNDVAQQMERSEQSSRELANTNEKIEELAARFINGAGQSAQPATLQ